MAIWKKIYCLQCKTTKQIICSPSDHPSTCSDCELINKTKKQNAWFAKLNKMTLKQRVRRLEENEFNGIIRRRHSAIY